MLRASPCGSAGKESACNAGVLGLIPGLGRFPGEGKGYPLQYSGLENSMDYIVHGIVKNKTWPSEFHFQTSLGLAHYSSFFPHMKLAIGTMALLDTSLPSSPDIQAISPIFGYTISTSGFYCWGDRKRERHQELISTLFSMLCPRSDTRHCSSHLICHN